VVEKIGVEGRELGRILLACAVVAIVAVACAAAVHNACFSPPVPFSTPDPGTPRGNYCDAVNPTQPWLSLTLLPVAVSLVVAFIFRRHWRVLMLVTVAIAGLLVANALVANNLDYASPFAP
jgi:hypothetical protein